MHRFRALAAVVVLSAAACGDPAAVDVDAGPLPDSGAAIDGGAGIDGGAVIDGGAAIDAGAASDAGSDAGATGACGGARPDVSGITQSEGLVIARDGTIYYSQPGGVGRLVPGGTPEDDWARLPGFGDTVWGLTLDAANETLYFGSPSTGSVHRVDLTAATPTPAVFVSAAGQPNGLAIGPDGALYYSDFGGGHVYRVPTGGATGTRARVTTSRISQANGIAFLADGSLLVAAFSSGAIVRLTLGSGTETARTTFASGLGAADGVAVDADGRVYVADGAGGRVVRLEPDGSGPIDVLDVGSPASLEFGAGALDCEDLYVSGGGPMRRYEAGTARGAAVPWH